MNPTTTIYDEIQRIAGDLGANFAYGRKSEINIQGDNNPFPAIILIEPDDIGFNFNTNDGNINDYDTVFIQFVDQIEMANQAEFRRPVVNQMRNLAGRFVQELVSSDVVSIVTTAPTFRISGILVVDTYDVNVIGIEIQVPLALIFPRACGGDY